MIILSVESSCDETAVAITENGRKVLADEIFSQIDMHAIYGGVVPEIASRNHVRKIDILAESAIKKAGISKTDIDAVAVTYAPGLIGALLVGLNFAKGAAFSLNLPIIPVHHLRGHIAANYIAFPDLEPPFVALTVSGGNTVIVDVRGYTDMSIIGQTRDDAAGECFDKIARLMGLPYPGGLPLNKLALTGNDKAFKLPVPKLDGNPFDMSFSGLKTAVINIMHNAEERGEKINKADLAASFQRAVSESLVPRTIDAAKSLGYNKITIAGGVAANSRIREDFMETAKKSGISVFAPPLKLCGDNGAMIGCQGYYEYLAGTRAGTDLNAYATMPVDKPVYR